jgi:hypothetical protein
VAIQDILGSVWVHLFIGPGEALQVPMPELDGLGIVDARYHRGVLAVSTAGESDGATVRRFFRFDREHRHHDCRRFEDACHVGLNFAVLDTGVCVCLDGSDRLDLFGALCGAAGTRAIEDVGVPTGLRLVADESALLGCSDRSVIRLRQSS